MISQAVARGKVWHQRLVPFRHGFHYPLWLVWCDLAEVDVKEGESMPAGIPVEVWFGNGPEQ